MEIDKFEILREFSQEQSTRLLALSQVLEDLPPLPGVVDVRPSLFTGLFVESYDPDATVEALIEVGYVVYFGSTANQITVRRSGYDQQVQVTRVSAPEEDEVDRERSEPIGTEALHDLSPA